MNISRLGALSAAIITFLPAASSAALIDNGGGLIYDNVLDITWAQPDIRRTWDDANTWTAGLTLGGVSGWRLPYISVTAGANQLSPNPGPIDCATTSLNCDDNELGYMYFKNLASNPVSALFPNLQSASYWSGTPESANNAWFFDFTKETQPHHGFGAKTSTGFSWAVHAGNVSPVPIPAAVWLFGSGLIGLIGLARRKKA